jgi:hypothetical protein
MLLGASLQTSQAKALDRQRPKTKKVPVCKSIWPSTELHLKWSCEETGSTHVVVYFPEFSNDSIYIGYATELWSYADVVDGSLARLQNGTIMAHQIPLAGGNGSVNAGDN